MNLEKWKELCKKYIDCYGEFDSPFVEVTNDKIVMGAKCSGCCEFSASLIDDLKEILGIQSCNIQIDTSPFHSDFVDLTITCNL